MMRALAFLLLSFVAATTTADDRGQARGEEWRFWGASPGGVRFSPLRQIDRRNVKSLARAWTYDTGEIRLGRGAGDAFPKPGFTTTPLVVDGLLYLSTASSRVMALEAETGKEVWVFDPQAGKAEREFAAQRGVSYWEAPAKTGAACERRILFGTVDCRLIALDAKTGRPCSDFGDRGAVDLRADDGQRFVEKPSWGSRITAPPAIFEDIVITGRALEESPGRGPNGDVRAYDVRTGKPRWRFHTVPRPGEFGHDTWEGDSWKDRMGVNVWSVMSVDTERGLVFLPLGSPASDFYGGDRKGANLFGNSIVALDARTGERRWHFQMVHHDLWDYDMPAQPVLVTVMRDGKEVPGVLQVTKMGFVYVFHRETGQPLFPVEERPVPASTVPGEWTSPTQPFPVKPLPLGRTSITSDQLSSVTPDSAKTCRTRFDDAKNGSIFTPLGLDKGIFFPGLHGGGHWGGAAYDPTTGLAYIGANEIGAYGYIKKTDEGSALPYRLSGILDDIWFVDENNWPCQQPPWGTLNALDVSTGEYLWRVPLGQVDELEKRGVPRTGRQNLGGAIVTAGGLVFVGATADRRFRAFDAKTGAELWTAEVPANAHATPMTFQGKDGRQYVVIAAGGGGFWRRLSSTLSDELIAFALPR